MGKIVRILNHNAVIVHDAQDNRVLLLLDKGIGFGKKINEQMDPPYSGKIYELQKETSKGPTKDVLNHLEPQYLEEIPIPVYPLGRKPGRLVPQGA
mgnify:CR=1 FL=1